MPEDSRRAVAALPRAPGSEAGAPDLLGAVADGRATASPLRLDGTAREQHAGAAGAYSRGRVSPTPYDAVAHGPVQGLSVTEVLVDGQFDIYEDVRASKYLQISIGSDGHGRPNRVDIRASRYVGIIPINPRVVIRVHPPEMPEASLRRLLGASGYVPDAELTRHLRGYRAGVGRMPAVIAALARAFLSAAEEVTRRGLLQDYRRRTEETAFPRGRLLMDRTVRLHARGAHARVAASWAERDIDTAPNQLLKLAAWMLRREELARLGFTSREDKRLADEIGLGANRVFARLRGVTLERHPRARRALLADPRVARPEALPQARDYYAPALRLAALLVQERGLDLGPSEGTARAQPLLLNLEEAFEGYLRNTLDADLRTRDSRLRAVDGKRDDGRKRLLSGGMWTGNATPDIVVLRGDPKRGRGEYLTVVEVKFRDPAKPQVERSDLEQTIAYALSYGVSAAIVAHPRGTKEPTGLRHLGDVQGIRLYGYAFDLSVDSLEHEELAFADTVLSIARQNLPDPGIRLTG